MILCCGEALIDMILAKTAAGEDAYIPRPGGAVFNTAIALGRLGVRTGFLSGVSTDPFGERLAAALAADGVDASRLIRSDRPTTLAMVHLKDGAATYSFHDEGSAGRMISADDAKDPPKDAKTLFFGGISLAAEPAADAYAEMLARWRAGRMVMIDPNIRPAFIRDEARYRARLSAMFALSDIVKVSDEDLAWLTGRDAVEAGAREILGSGPATVIVTKGEKGATAFTETGALSVPARQVECVDTVGAGDTFNAGFLAALAERGALRRDPGEQDLMAALALGAAAAAVVCTRTGADPPRRKDLP